MIVVCTATPLIALAAAGQFDLLRAVYGEITIPDAVYHEVVVAGAGEAGGREVAAAAWIKRHTVRNAGFWIGDDLHAAVLKTAGESRSRRKDNDETVNDY